jgi:hypothetical protein
MSFQRRWLTIAAGGLLIAAFLLVNVVVGSGGVRHGSDTRRYVPGAEQLRSGQPLEGSQIRYAGYIAVIAASEAIGAGQVGVVIVQVIAAALAAVALFDLGRRLQGPVAGWVAALAFVANPDIARWNFYILTEPLYISAIVLATWAIVGVLDDPKRWWLAVLLTVVAASLRPSGWVLVPITVACIVAALLRGQRARWPAVIGLAAIFMLFAIMLPFTQTIGNDDPAHLLRNGEVIGGMVRLSMPANASEAGTGWLGVADYALRHPFASFKVMAARVAAELAHVRPVYSTAHNLAALIMVLPLYATAILGIRYTRRPDIAAWIGAVIIAHLAIVAVTVADWDGRYLLYVLPLIGLFSGCAVGHWLERLRPRWSMLLVDAPAS